MKSNPTMLDAYGASVSHLRLGAESMETSRVRRLPLTSKRRGGKHTADPVYHWTFIFEAFKKLRKTPRGVNFSFVRHGESVANAQGLVTGSMDSPLTDAGTHQARTTGKNLRGQSFDKVFASSLSRAHDTMALVLEEAGVTASHVIDSRLDERSLGDLEGNASRHIPEFAAGDLDFTPRNGESYRDLCARCLSFLIDVWHRDVESLAVDASPNILVFSHMGPLRIFDSVFNRIPSAEKMMACHFDNAEIVEYQVRELHLPPFLLTR